MRKQFLSLLAAAAVAAPLAVQADDEKDLFATLDANKDGFVVKDEVPAEKQRLFERLVRSNDKNGDGKLSGEEFAAKPEQPRTPVPEGGAGRDFDPEEVFKRLDRDADGKLTKDEAPERIKENFDRIDGNSDGKIDLAEFRAVAARLASDRPGADAAREAAAVFDRSDANKDGKLAADEVPEDRREVFLRAIAKIDTDGDKAVTKEEFLKAYVLMRGGGEPGARPGPGPSPGGAVPLIRLLDADGNGELSADEIANASKTLLKLDRNGDGKLTREELPSAPPGGGPEGRPGAEQLLRRLKEADRNGDGKIQKDEAPPGLADLFDRADRNADGALDEAEVRGVAERLGQRPRDGGDRPREQPKPRD